MTAQLKTIVITGANKGIGFGVADNLAEKIGWQIVLACRDLKRAEDSRRRLVDKHRDARVMVE
jgi:NAD(P)-dependent dehydrogenase (short-subunit alcohol dehydrogenase family)